MKKILTIQKALQILKQGGVVAYPTETFYGLGVDPHNKAALEKIFYIKQREREKPISLILSSTHQLKKWVVGLGAREKKLIKEFWPGPLTLVFKAKKSVSPLLTAGTGKIGLRVSPEAHCQKLARGLSGAITATSANLSGNNSRTSASAVAQEMGSRIDGVVSTKTLKKSKGSTILDISTKKIKVLREGEISLKALKPYIDL